MNVNNERGTVGSPTYIMILLILSAFTAVFLGALLSFLGLI